jgi:hypothetical protein
MPAGFTSKSADSATPEIQVLRTEYLMRHQVRFATGTG